MKSYFLLLRLNLRNLLAGFRGAMRKPNGKIDISRLILYPLALLGMLTLAGFVIFMEFSMFSAFEMLNAPEMLPGLAILLAMVTALLFSVFQMLAALYFSRDTASMAYLPLTSRTVLAAKCTEVYVSELLFPLLIAAPAVVLYGIHYAADWTYYLRMVPVLLAVNCIPLTISLLLASILGRFTSLTRHKEVWVVLGTVLMLVVVLGLEWSILPKIPEDADAAFFAQMLTGVQPMLRAFIHAFPPVAWAVDGIAGDWLQWLAFLAVSIGGAALAIALVGGSYLDTTLRQNEGSRKARRVRVTDKTFRAHSPFMAIYRREWNEILKVPVYLLNGVLGAMMLPIMLIGMSVGMSSEQDSEVSWNFLLRLMQDSVSPMDVMLILTALLMFISWVNPIIATAISREGGRMPIAKYIPVSPRTQLWAKLSVSLTINGAAILLMGIAVAALLGTRYLGAVLGAVVLANLFSLATGCIALTIDASRPILHWQTEQQVMKQNMNQMICMLVVLLVALIPVAGVVGMMVLSSAAQEMEAPSMLMRFAAEHAVGLRSAVAALLMAACCGSPSARKAAATKTEVKHGPEIVLAAPDTVGGTSVNEALANRRSWREYAAAPLTLEELSGVVWAAAGINRPGRPSPVSRPSSPPHSASAPSRPSSPHSSAPSRPSPSPKPSNPGNSHGMHRR